MTTSDTNCAFGRGALQSLTVVSTGLPRPDRRRHPRVRRRLINLLELLEEGVNYRRLDADAVIARQSPSALCQRQYT